MFMSGEGTVFSEIDRLFSRDSPVSIWDIATGRLVSAIGENEPALLRFCLSPDGVALYTCGDKVLAWAATKPAHVIQRCDTSGRRTISIAVSPDGKMLAAGSRDGTVLVWDIGSSRRLATLIHRAGPVYGLAFSRPSTELVAAGEGGVATVWHIDVLPEKRK